MATKRPTGMDEEARDIGRRLRALRIESGLSAEAVAEALAMTPANWSHYESGRNSYRGLDLPKVAELFDLTLDQLVERLLKPRPKASDARGPVAHTFYEWLRKYPGLDHDLRMLQTRELSEKGLNALRGVIEQVYDTSPPAEGEPE